MNKTFRKGSLSFQVDGDLGANSAFCSQVILALQSTTYTSHPTTTTMPARLPHRLPTTLALRPRQPQCFVPLRTVRNYADGELGRMKEDVTEKDYKEHIPHVSEEDAAIKSAMHEQGPNIDQGTKASEVGYSLYPQILGPRLMSFRL